jgi:hypothetical protein
MISILGIAFVLANQSGPTTEPTPPSTTATEQPAKKEEPIGPLKQENECKEQKKEEKPLNIAGITSIVGSATTVAGALTGVVIGLVSLPAPWDYWKYAEDLQRAEAAFRDDPSRKHLDDAATARAGMTRIEQALDKQTGVLISSGAAVLTGAVGLVSSIVVVAGE